MECTTERTKLPPTSAVALALAVGAVATGCSTDTPSGAASPSSAQTAPPSAADTASAVATALASGSSAAAASTAAAVPGAPAGMKKGAHGSVSELQLNPADQAKAAAAAKGQLLGIVAPLSAEYLASVVSGAKQVAGTIGLRTQVADYQFDAAKGVTAIESLVSQGAKYLVVVLTDPKAMIGAVKAAEAKGVTVVQFAGQQVADEAGGYSVSISDAELGTAQGDVAAEAARPLGKTTVAILDFPSQPNVVIRADNLEREMKAKNPDITVVARVPGGTQDIGLTATETLLQKFPKLGGVASVNDAGAYGVAQALKAAGRTPKDAFVIGADAEGKAKKDISAGGIFKATVDTQPTLTGQAAAGVVGQLLAGNSVAQYTTVPVKAFTG